MHESALQWNAINVINLLEISGANELSFFVCFIWEPLYISQQKRESFSFPWLPHCGIELTVDEITILGWANT